MEELRSEGKQSGSAVWAVHLSTHQLSKASKGQMGWMSWKGEAEMAQRIKLLTVLTRNPIYAMYSQRKKKTQHKPHSTECGRLNKGCACPQKQ